jgi:N-acetylglucosaminyl-diphospho-decaprenol L-rhamnosyltransferase
MDEQLGVVVVAHNRADLALSCIGSLAAAIPRANRVVVVNAPADVPGVELVALREVAEVITNDQPHGYGENANLGVQALSAAADVVVISNDDVIYSPDSLGRLAAAVRSNPGVAVAGPAVVDQAGVPQPSSFAFPTLISEVASDLILPKFAARAVRDRFQSTGPAGPGEVDWVLGAAFAINRAAFDGVGGFDPRYHLYSEETDLCRRLSNRNWRTLHCTEAVVCHLGNASTPDTVAGARRAAASRRIYIGIHWSRRKRALLAALRPLVSAWNALYTVGGIALQPGSRTRRVDTLRMHRASRSQQARPGTP